MADNIELSYEKIRELYEKEFCSLTFEGTYEKISSMRAHKYINDFLIFYCEDLLNYIVLFYFWYPENLFEKDELVPLYCSAAELISEDELYYKAVLDFFKGDNSACCKKISAFLDCNENKEFIYSEEQFINSFFNVFKDSCLHIWRILEAKMMKHNSSENVIELCRFINIYCNTDSNEKVTELALEYIRKFPDSLFMREILGWLYSENKMWNNAAAYFDDIEHSLIICDSVLYFNKAWVYDHLKEYTFSEKYYRECLKINSQYDWAMNNLAYCLYRQKKYTEALQILEQCLEEELDLPNSANNYVRVLIAMKQFKKAKDFLKTTKFKISKDLRQKVTKARSVDMSYSEEEFINEEIDIVRNEIRYTAKESQFMSEKVLEDELTAKIEAGIPVFGMNLKMYKRKGEYGRQYIIPVGRLDLLCEDDNDNLYVVELKKDDGYDDVYEQIERYLDWFDKSRKFKNKNVYGIICMNNPDKKLIKKVMDNDRIRLFEYQIKYNEVKIKR